MPTIRVALTFRSVPVRGQLTIVHGRFVSSDRSDSATVRGFQFDGVSGPTLLVNIECGYLGRGGKSTRVTVRAGDQGFTFFARDVSNVRPIVVPSVGVAVHSGEGQETYEQLSQAATVGHPPTTLDHIRQSPEESYGAAAARTQDMRCQTWLGISRDMRLFAIDAIQPGGLWGWVQPRNHIVPIKAPELADEAGTLSYRFALGRGTSCVNTIQRRLDDGELPILHGSAMDGDVRYDLTAFCSLESTLLSDGVRGTHYLVANGHEYGHMFTPAEQQEYDRLLPTELDRDEETILYLRATATNTGTSPQYAWFRAPQVMIDTHFASRHIDHEAETGFGRFGSGRVFCLSRVDGLPMRDPEMAVLVEPKQSVVFEFALPHQPLSQARAEALSQWSFAQRLVDCRTFWRAKLDSAAQIRLPEARVQEMARAGLLHLDLITYGLDPDRPLAASTGNYSPIGTESAPIILFYDAMGWHDVAERSIEFFMEKQHQDGFIKNFGGYESETGPVLYVIGEHYRYTHDTAWLERIAPKAIKACDYLIAWRRRNERPELRGRGYGMIDGKVADPEDPTHYFFNSGLFLPGNQADGRVSPRHRARRRAAPGNGSDVDAARHTLRAQARHHAGTGRPPQGWNMVSHGADLGRGGRACGTLCRVRALFHPQRVHEP